MTRWLLPLLLLAGCDNASVPLPERCQQVGVAVAFSDTVTGTILEEHIGTEDVVSIKCHSPFSTLHGCAIPVAPGQYVLWYVDDPAERDHERCHALYEERNHN